jgi:glycosyltransferase involved in cell wall biosynthesis
VRVMFVSGTSVGGAARSTHELAEKLAGLGHEVAVLMKTEGHALRTLVYEKQLDLWTKLHGRPPSGLVRFLMNRMGEVPRTGNGQPYPTWRSVFPENALRRVIGAFNPDIVVVNSILRPAWRAIREKLRASGVPSVLYLREESALGHLSISNAPPDLLLANTESFANDARRLGFTALTIPSVIDLRKCSIDSSREKVLLVNPILSHGVEIGWKLARARPDLSFVFQESWPLRRRTASRLAARAAEAGNVEFRRATQDPRAIYRDAAVLLAPHRVPNRARVVVEAASNGIPSITSSVAGLVEIVGSGGIVVDVEAAIGAWHAALSRVWDDPMTYAELTSRAKQQANRVARESLKSLNVLETALEKLVDQSRKSPV